MLFEDRGEIKIGTSYQATIDQIPDVINPEEDTRRHEDLEELVWNPENELSDKVRDTKEIFGTFI